MNRLLNRAQWEESNDLTPVRIGLVLMEIFMVEWSMLIQTIDFPPQQHQYLHQFSIFLNADLTIGFSSVRASKWAIHHSIILEVDDFDQKLLAKSMLSRKWINFL